MKKLLLILMLAAPSAYAQKALNVDSINKLAKEILQLDQQLRLDLINSKDEQERQLAAIRCAQQDYINQSTIFPIVDQIIENDVWEGFTDDTWKTCFYVIHHSNHDARLKYQDFIKTCFEKGLITGNKYLLLIDRIHVHQNKAQPFGSQSKELDNGKIIRFPARTQPERDSLFRSIGLDIELFRVVNGSVSYGEADDSEITPNSQDDLIEVAPHEFAILGVIQFTDKQEVENAAIKVDGQVMAATDENGFFFFKVAKDKIPHKLAIEYKGSNSDYELDKDKLNGDFILFTHIINHSD